MSCYPPIFSLPFLFSFSPFGLSLCSSLPTWTFSPSMLSLLFFPSLSQTPLSLRLMCPSSPTVVFILFFPILFMLGWIPQADTFSIYFLEQVDMNVFGGTASTGLVCSLYAISRSILVGVVLWLLGYAAFSTLEVGMYKLNILVQKLYHLYLI